MSKTYILTYSPRNPHNEYPWPLHIIEMEANSEAEARNAMWTIRDLDKILACEELSSLIGRTRITNEERLERIKKKTESAALFMNQKRYRDAAGEYDDAATECRAVKKEYDSIHFGDNFWRTMYELSKKQLELKYLVENYITSDWRDWNRKLSVCVAENKYDECTYLYGKELMEKKDYRQAAEQFGKSQYGDAGKLYSKCTYNSGKELMEKKEYRQAAEQFGKSQFGDARKMHFECNYLYGKELMEKQQYTEAAEKFAKITELIDYKDARDLYSECIYFAGRGLAEKNDYKNAADQFGLIADYNGTADWRSEYYFLYGKVLMSLKEYRKAADQFEKIEGYKDATVMFRECCLLNGKELLEKKQYEKAAEAFEKAGKYKDASTLLSYARGNARMKSGDYIGAANDFKSLKGYKDARSLRTSCTWNSVIQLLKQKKPVQAVKEVLKNETITTVVASIAGIILFIVIVTGLIQRIQYRQAVKKYEDSIKNASVGDVVVFGHYEQDNNKKNGKEEVEWIVLAKEDDRVLVISRYALDNRPYYYSWVNSRKDVTWRTSTLRSWLNKSFLKNAFNLGEQKMILRSLVSADKNPSYNTRAGSNTRDKVFLLSVSEAKEYCSKSVMKCEPTEYCRSRNSWDFISGWWLRSPGSEADRAAYASESVIFDAYVDEERYAVRPAIWIYIG